MGQELKIELDDEVFRHLKELCKGDKNKMQEYIKKALKNKINQEKIDRASAKTKLKNL